MEMESDEMSGYAWTICEEVRDGRLHRWLSDGRHLVLNAWGWEEVK